MSHVESHVESQFKPRYIPTDAIRYCTRLFSLVLALLFSQMGLTINVAKAACNDCVFPGQHWQTVAPNELAQYGWSSKKLDKVTQYLSDVSNATGIVVVDRGRVVYTYGNVDELSYVASVRKSILSLLFGTWVAEGKINLDKTLADLDFDDVGGLLPLEKQATIRDIISARSGIYHEASNTGDDTDAAPARGTISPGTYMLYNNWDFNAAGGLFELLTQKNIYDELQRQLAIPLQFEDWQRSRQQKTGDSSKSKYLAYHMWLSTRDMARIGLLMLNEGKWGEQQIIPKAWMKEITTTITPLAEMNPSWRRSGYFGYGDMLWIWDGPYAEGPFKGAYTSRGKYGQWISVFPEINLVVAHKTHDKYGLSTSWGDWQRTLELLFEAKGVKMTQPYPWRA